MAQLLNKRGGGRFDAGDERRFGELLRNMGVILETWWQMHLAQARSAEPALPPGP